LPHKENCSSLKAGHVHWTFIAAASSSLSLDNGQVIKLNKMPAVDLDNSTVPSCCLSSEAVEYF